jgi:hypothetical protein
MKEAGRRRAENPARGTGEMKMMQGYIGHVLEDVYRQILISI